MPTPVARLWAAFLLAFGRLLKWSGLTGASMHAFGWAALHAERPEVLEHYAFSLIETGRLAEALQVMERESSKPRSCAAAHYQYGWLLQELGRTSDALQAFDAGLALDPSDSRIHFARGSCLERLARMQEAAEAYERARRHDPANALAHANLGVILAKNGDPSGALECHERAYELLPDTTNARNLSSVLGDLQRFDDAERVLRASLSRDPASLDLRLDLASVLLEKDCAAEAQELLHPIVRARPTDQRTLSVLTLSYLLQRKGEEALRTAELALKEHPGDAWAHSTLGCVWLQLGNAQKALDSLDEALRLDSGNDAEIAAWRAAALARLGRHGEALDAFEGALRLDSRILARDEELAACYEQSRTACRQG